MNVTTLLNNIIELKDIIKDLYNKTQVQNKELTNKEQELTSKTTTIEVQNETIKNLKFQLATALQARFGRKSEKYIDDKQFSLFDEADISEVELDLDKEDEEMWSKIKTLLRKISARTKSNFHTALKNSLLAVTNSDLFGWFKHSGYIDQSFREAL